MEVDVDDGNVLRDDPLVVSQALVDGVQQCCVFFDGFLKFFLCGDGILLEVETSEFAVALDQGGEVLFNKSFLSWGGSKKFWLPFGSNVSYNGIVLSDDNSINLKIWQVRKVSVELLLLLLLPFLLISKFNVVDVSSGSGGSQSAHGSKSSDSPVSVFSFGVDHLNLFV